MRTSLKLHCTCPVCDAVEVLRVRTARQHSDYSDQGFLPVAKPGENGVGTYTVYICASCGYAEWFANDLDELRELASQHPGPGGPVALLQGPRQPPGTPYR